MLKSVLFRLPRRYRIVAFSPSAASRFDRQALLLREAAVPFGAQLRHARRRFALLLARPPAQLAFRFGVVNTEAFRFGLNDRSAARKFVHAGTVDSGQGEAVAMLLNSVA